VYRSTDPEFRDPRVITNALGTDKFGNGVPMATVRPCERQSRDSPTNRSREVHYWLGRIRVSCIRFTDTTVKNGQEYFYAVCASRPTATTRSGFFPSENAITVSRTLRGGTVLLSMSWNVRPEPASPAIRGHGDTGEAHRRDGERRDRLTILDSEVCPR